MCKIMALEITQQNFQQEVLEAKTTVLVDFWAPWCGPCRMQAPILEDFAKTAAGVKVVKVNVDDNPELAQKYNIMSIPSLLVFKDGIVAKTAVGLRDKNGLTELCK